MKRNTQRAVAVSVAIMMLISCAGNRAPRVQAQNAALAVGEAILAIDQAERTLYATGTMVYTKADHDRVGAGILKALYASRALERAVAGWPQDGSSTNDAVDQASAGLLSALADLESILPATEQARVVLVSTIRAARAALAAWRQP